MLWWTLLKLRSADPGRRAEAAREAAAQGNRAAVARLIEALDDPDPGVRTAVAEALGNLGDPRAVEPLRRVLAPRGRAEGNRRTEGDADQHAAVRALSKLGESAVDALVMALQSDDKSLRKSAVQALGASRSPRAAGPLVERLGDPRSDVRKAAAAALANLGAPSSLAGLADALGHRDPETRRAAAEALGRIGGSEAVPPLSRATTDGDEAVQLAVIDALKAIGGVDAALALKPALERGRKTVRSAAAAALRAMPLVPGTAAERATVAVLTGDFAAAVREGDAAFEPLVEALSSGLAGTRASAAAALGELRARRAAPALARLLSDHDSDVCRRAAFALSEIGADAVPATIDALSSPHASAQRLAAEVLGKTGGIRAVGPLLAVLERNREASSHYPEPTEAARAARDALIGILTASAGSIPSGELRTAAEAPDAASRHQVGDDEQTLHWETVVDCGVLRELAAAELARRHEP